MAILYAALTGLPRLERGEAEAAGLARLPVLEGLLSRGSRLPPAPDWRRWVLGVAGLSAAAGDLPLGRLAAAAHGLAPAREETWLLASPVRLRPGTTSVRLEREVRLDAAGAGALAARFNADWQGEPWTLAAAGTALVLRHPQPLGLATQDPALLVGQDIGVALPAGADGPRLTRLMTEIQMWLHANGIAGDANALWLWGAGREALRGTAAWPALGDFDPPLAAARACHPGVAPAAGEIRAVSVAAWLAGGADLAALDAAFAADLEARLARGDLARAFVHHDGAVYALRRRDRLRRWRRVRPWWELGA